MSFSSIEEVEHALNAGEVHMHAKITCRIKQIDETGQEVSKRYETTPGRVRLGALLPLNAKAPFELVNTLLRKKDVQKVIDTVYRYCGQKESSTCSTKAPSSAAHVLVSCRPRAPAGDSHPLLQSLPVTSLPALPTAPLWLRIQLKVYRYYVSRL